MNAEAHNILSGEQKRKGFLKKFSRDQVVGK
jgi:hypothetical protein